MSGLFEVIGNGLKDSFLMAWEVWWALVIGFAISAVVQAWVPRERIEAALAGGGIRSLAKATGLGAASSSCSYAAIAIAKSLFQKGASAASALAFQFASTNLVVELSVLLAVLLGWQFTLAEFTGGPIMIVLLVLMLRATLKPAMIDAARKQAERGLAGRMEGHAAMDMSLHEGTFWQKLSSAKGITASSHYYWMDWYSLWPDIAGGLLISGCLAAWVPQHFWQGLFLTGHPVLARLWGPFIGPLVAVLSFVCSVGNVPLAAVLWNGGISFGGVLAFLFADLIILPILNIYRKYYGLKMAALLFVVFYASMSLAALAVEYLFLFLHLIPEHGHAQIMQESIHWNYTSILNILFLIVTALLLWRFLKTGGPAMLKMMDAPPPPDAPAHHCHH